MNYSDTQIVTDDEPQVEVALRVLPQIGRALLVGVARHAERSGLSLGQMKAMAQLHQSGRATVGAVAGALGVSMPAASELIDQLADRGLVERGTNPADRRQVVLRLTPKAEQITAELRDLRRARIRAALARLAPEQRPVFVPVLTALAEALQPEGDPGDASCPSVIEAVLRRPDQPG